MSPRQADKLIKLGTEVELYCPRYGQQSFKATVTRRDRWHLFVTYTSGEQGVFERSDVELYD